MEEKENSGLSKELEDGKTLKCICASNQEGGNKTSYKYLLLVSKHKNVAFPGEEWAGKFSDSEIMEWFHLIRKEEDLHALAKKVYLERVKKEDL